MSGSWISIPGGAPPESLRSPRTVPRWIRRASVQYGCDPARDLAQAKEPMRVLLQLVPGILRGRPHRRGNMESPQVSPRGTSLPKPQCPHLYRGETGHLPEGVTPLRTGGTHHGHCFGLDVEGREWSRKRFTGKSWIQDTKRHPQGTPFCLPHSPISSPLALCLHQPTPL